MIEIKNEDLNEKIEKEILPNLISIAEFEIGNKDENRGKKIFLRKEFSIYNESENKLKSKLNIIFKSEKFLKK